MSGITDDIRIREIRALITPNEVMGEFAATETAIETVSSSRAALHDILHGKDDRLAVVIGPCSIHDPDAAGCRPDAYPAKIIGHREGRERALAAGRQAR